jgi:hypothetical protein
MTGHLTPTDGLTTAELLVMANTHPNRTVRGRANKLLAKAGITARPGPGEEAETPGRLAASVASGGRTGRPVAARRSLAVRRGR